MLWHERAQAERLAPGTIRRYLSSLAMVDPQLGSLHLDEVRRPILLAIARRAGTTNATKRRDLTAVSAVLRAAVHEGWIEDNPARAFDRTAIRERRDPIILPADHEVEALIERLDRTRPETVRTLGALVRTLELTGMRLEEAAGLQWRQVDLHRGAITLERTKGRRLRTVTLTAQATAQLRAIPRRLGCPWVFWRGDGVRYSPKSISGTIMVARRSLGLTWRTHDLRHLYAVRYLRNGGSIYRLQQELGHVTIRTTEDYLRFLTPEEAERARLSA